MLDPKELLDYDRSGMAQWSQEAEDEALENHPDLFYNHLVIAKHLSEWAQRLEEDKGAVADYGMFVTALRDVAAHLRQGDYLPGGTFYEDVTSGR